MRNHSRTGGDGFFTCQAKSVETRPRKRRQASSKFDICNPEKFELQIRELIDDVIDGRLKSDFIASRVDQLDKTLAAIVGAYPPPGTFNLSELLGSLAGKLLRSGNPVLAELVALRAAKFDTDGEGEPRINEMLACQLGDIWDAMGRHAEAANLVHQATLGAQRRLWPEPLVFYMLYQCAASAMLAGDYGMAARAYARAMLMKTIDLRKAPLLCGTEHLGYQEKLFKIGALPVYDLQLAPVELEYERIMEERSRTEAEKRRLAGLQG